MEALSLKLKRIDNRLGKIESRTRQHGGTSKQSNIHTAPQQAYQARPHKQTDGRRTTDSHSRRITDSGRTQTVDGPATGADVLVTSVLPVKHNTTQQFTLVPTL